MKVKLVSENKIRKNQQAQSLSQGVGSLLGAMGGAMTHRADQNAAMQAGQQLNQELGTNVPSNVYSRVSPGALLGMLTNAQMAAKAQSENMARITEAETLRGRARVEAEGLRMRAQQPYREAMTKRAEQLTATEIAKKAQADAQRMAAQRAGLDPDLDPSLQAIQMRERNKSGGGQWDWKQSGLDEGQMRTLHGRGLTAGVLGQMSPASRGAAISKALIPGGGGMKFSDIRGNKQALERDVWSIDNELYGPELDNGTRNYELSIDAQIMAHRAAGREEQAKQLEAKKPQLEARKNQLYTSLGQYTDQLMQGNGLPSDSEPVDLDTLLGDLGVDDEE